MQTVVDSQIVCTVRWRNWKSWPYILTSLKSVLLSIPSFSWWSNYFWKVALYVWCSLRGGALFQMLSRMLFAWQQHFFSLKKSKNCEKLPNFGDFSRLLRIMSGFHNFHRKMCVLSQKRWWVHDKIKYLFFPTKSIQGCFVLVSIFGMLL